MRVLLTAVPSVGHVVPLLGVGSALQEAGHEVRIATHPSRHPLVAAAGLTAVAAGMSDEERDAERRRRWPDSVARPPATWAVRMFTAIAAPSMLADLRLVIDGWKPHLVVHEEGEYAGPVAAAVAGIPWVTHAWGSPLRSAADLRRLESDAGELWTGAGLAMPSRAGLYEHGVIDPCPPLLATDAEPPVPSWAVQPSILGSGDGGPAEDGRDRSTCYVGFGTVPQFAGTVPEIAAAVRGAIAGGLHVVVTTSDAALAGAVRSAVGSGAVEVREFVSLPELLPDCRLVVTHGGAGTTLAALAHGIPVVIIPRGAPSQERMAGAVARAGVGRVVQTDGATSTVITDVVRAAALDDAIVEQARLAQRQIAAMPRPKALVAPLEALAG